MTVSILLRFVYKLLCLDIFGKEMLILFTLAFSRNLNIGEGITICGFTKGTNNRNIL